MHAVSAAACGVDIEVPVSLRNPPLGAVETIPTPGAARNGLSEDWPIKTLFAFGSGGLAGGDDEPG